VEVRIFNPFSRKTGRTSQYVTAWIGDPGCHKQVVHGRQPGDHPGRRKSATNISRRSGVAFADLDVIGRRAGRRDVSTAFDVLEQRTGPTPFGLIESPSTPEDRRKRAAVERFVAAQAGSVYLKAGELRPATSCGRTRSILGGNAVVVYDRPDRCS